jgi:NADH-quinone oxidoreductase subunit N
VTAPLIWIVLPLVLASGLWLFRRNTRLTTILGSLICGILSFLAIVLPIGDVIQVGAIKIEIGSMLTVLGRRFILLAADKYLLAFVYAAGTFWFAGTWVLRVHHSFISLGLGVIAILLAALAVEPFLYSALIFEIAILVSIPLLVKPGMAIGKGALRFLIYQSLGMPFLLLAGWFLGGTGSNLSDPLLLNQAIVLMGLGFAFWLAIFPFHTWIPILAEEANPYISGFIMAFFPPMVIFILLDFINGLTWVRESEIFFTALQISGVIMIFTGGVWSAFQKNVSRLFGYAVIIETGFTLVAISLRSGDGLLYTVMILLPRIIALALWALSMTILKDQNLKLDFESLQGLIYRTPIGALGIVSAVLSMAGLPLLASFSLRQSVVETLANIRPGIIIWVVLGMTGFLIGGFRLVWEVTAKTQKSPLASPTRIATGLILTAIVLLFLLGIAPRSILSVMARILAAYPNLTW